VARAAGNPAFFRKELILMARVFLLVLAAVLSAPGAFGHGVQLSVQVENTDILGTAYLSRNNPVRDGQVRLLSAGDEELLEQSQTDQKGQFRLTVPTSAMEQKLDLLLVVDAGAGHRARHTIPASALRTDEPKEQAPTDSQHSAHLTEEQVLRVVESAVQRQLEPLYEQLADNHRHVHASDVLAGIGYLVGIAGLMAWARSKRQGGN
jgi:nickel transport protein